MPFHEALDDALVSRHERHGDFINKVFQDDDLGALFRSMMLDQIYGRLRGLGEDESLDVVVHSGSAGS